MATFIDARSGDAAALPEADVCIAGAGAAGITIALDLARAGVRVLLLESGGEGLDGPTQSLYAGRNIGLDYYNLTSCRLRYYGGTTNHWGGYCSPFEPWHFDARPEAGLQGWPITYDDLRPWMDKANDMLGLDTALFDTDAAMAKVGQNPADLPDNNPESRIRSRPQQIIGRVRFGEQFGPELAAKDNVTVVFFANVVKVATTENGAEVTGLEMRTLDGQSFTARARHYVLACHAIENARLMLVSNDAISAGLGNRYDHVGRYFMEHPHIPGSHFVPSDKPLPMVWGDRAIPMQAGLSISICLKPEVTQEEGLLHTALRLNPVYEDQEVLEAFSGLKNSVMEPFDGDVASDMSTILSDPLVSARFLGLKAGLRDQRRVAWYEMEQAIEQAPNPDSRVVLSDRTDALGSPIADLHWALNEHDFHTFRRGQEIVGEELAALGYGRMIKGPDDDDTIRSEVEGHWHHVGTTRMSAEPRQGVVDADCRVHGMENLYVAGSGVFASCGTSPTMMIVTMARRLGDHLARRVQG